MTSTCRSRLAIAALPAALCLVTFSGLRAADDDVIPRQLPKDQRDNLQRFLQAHSIPDRFVPKDAKLVDPLPDTADTKITATPEKPIKQYVAQITPHRPVPGQEEVKQVDIYYYRPNPEKGKPGITVKHTVDVTTGKQVGDTEVLVKSHTPISREEVAEAVALAQAKYAPLQALYKGRDPKTVRWEYLQLMVNRKSERSEPGDRVVRFVFRAAPANEMDEPAPVAVVVNLTKGTVAAGDR